MSMNSKAISPVIASILMMVVVVALTIIMFGFSSGFMSGASTSTVEKGFAMTSSSSVGQIEAINTSGDEVYIRLTNDVGSEIDAVFVDNNRILCDSGSRTLTPSSQETLTLNSTTCPGLSITENVLIKVTGSNSFSAVGMSTS